MDHFNATVKDGKLVKTRRGLQVSRQRFNGLSFVNASPQDNPPAFGPSGATGATPAASASQQEIRFVETGSESARETPGGYRDDAEQQVLSGVDQVVKRQRRAARRGKSPVCRAGTPFQPLPSPVAEQNRQPKRSTAAHDIFQFDSSLGHRTSAATPERAQPLSNDDRALFERHINNMPRCMYPNEDILTYNPARGPEFYSMFTQDEAALHCVLMCGSIIDAAAARTEPNDLAYYVSKTCAVLNQKLSRDCAADAVTLYCIATLAWVGYYVGRFDHWHLHMSGLKKVLDLHGGLVGLPPWLLAELHRVDLRGAAALATSPYLPFKRRHKTVSGIIPHDERDHTAASVSAVLNPLHIHREVIATLFSVALFAAAVRQARQSQGTIAFEPHALTEEWQALTHALLTQPGPLRAPDHNDPDITYPNTTPSTITAPTAENTGPTLESYTSTTITPNPIQTVPAPNQREPHNPLTAALEPALRTATLIYLQTLPPEYPPNLTSHRLPLSLLRHHLREVLDNYHHHTRHDLPRENVDALRKAVAFLALVGERSSKLAKTGDRGATAMVAVGAAGAAREAAAGEAGEAGEAGAAGAAGAVGAAGAADNDSYPPDIFRECLREVVGLKFTAEHENEKERKVGVVGTAFKEGGEAMELVRVFGLGFVFGWDYRRG